MSQEPRSNLESAHISREDLRDLIQSQLQPLLEQENLEGAKTLLVPVQSADIADVIEQLPKGLQVLAFRLLSKDKAIAVYEYLEPNVQQSFLDEFKRQEVIEVIGHMSPDDRARLLEELPAKVVSRLLEQLSPEERQATALLLGYPPDTAGRIMTPEYVVIKENWTVAQVLERTRNASNTSEIIYYLYVTDATRHLRGVLSLRDLITAQPEQRVSEIMSRELVSVQTDIDQEEVARIIQQYDFFALPVVDHDSRLVGVITIDDVIDILEEETTEDIYALGGVQAGGDNYFQTNLFKVAQKRVGWLLILLVTNTVTSAVIQGQEAILSKFVALAAFIPLLIGTGGNVGAQSSTVVIRGLSTTELQGSEAAKIIGREAVAGTILGSMLGIVVTIWAYFLQDNLAIALSVGLSLFAITVLASVAGSALPFLFKYFSLDPALMSAPFITTAVDVLGVLIYFAIAGLLLDMPPTTSLLFSIE